MSRPYADEITSIQQHALQPCHELKMMEDNLKRIVPVVEKLEQAAQTFKRPRESRDFVRVDQNIPPSDPTEELAALRRKLSSALADLDRAGELLAVRRESITALLE